MQGTDFYAELGLSKGASDDEIKRAYRKLARKYHPDVSDAEDAEERFKRVSEAYAVLSDTEKRKLYDRYGVDGLRDGFDPDVYERMRSGGFGGGDIDLEELFGGFGNFAGGFPGFGMNFGGAPRRGRDVELGLRATFDQAVRGFSTKFTYQRPVRCPQCGGAGVIGQNVCHACRGGGLVEQAKTLTVNIPQGADDGDRIRLKGKGGQGRRNAPAGDLILRLQVEPHPSLRRDGLDLATRVDISPLDALLGVKAEVAALDGDLRVTVPAGVSSGSKLRLRGKGVERGGKKGDLLVEIGIDGSGIELEGEALELAERLRTMLQAEPVG